ncbi:MAG: arginyltransferase [Rhodospirillales bacterium]|nr:arginyltransferase [Rhodospirillales bacterium]
MKHDLAGLTAQYFFSTAPLPCPYLPGRTERRLVTELSGRQAVAVHDTLSRAGFRRSHGIAYVPVCRNCAACVAVRIVAGEFKPSRGQRRTLARNEDLIAIERPARATDEQYRLFRRYQRARHGNGEMARMDFADYQMLIEETPVDTLVVEFRDRDGRLVAGCLADRLADGFSAVYSFFDPSLTKRSLGTYMIMWLVEWTALLDLPYVYLGFWVDNCAKMDYKRVFRPMEAYTSEGWKRLEPLAARDRDREDAG